MSNAATLTRNAVAALVERHERQTGSRMAAYHMVAQTIGTSAEWVRSYISKKPRTKEPSFPIGLNILGAYDRICNRVEQIVDRERCAITKLKGETDAVNQLVNRVVAVAERAQASGKGEVS